MLRLLAVMAALCCLPRLPSLSVRCRPAPTRRTRWWSTPRKGRIVIKLRNDIAPGMRRG